MNTQFNEHYLFQPTFPSGEVVTYMRFDVEEDYNPRFGPRAFQHFINVEDLVCDVNLIKSNLWHGSKISLRAAANNLDGDDRSIHDIGDRLCFGEMVRLAVMSTAIDYLEERANCPREFKQLLDDVDVDGLIDDFEHSLNYLVDVTEPKVSSYLFGRNYSRECDKEDSDLRQEFWCTANEVIWHSLSCLKYAIHDPMSIFEILFRTEGYLKGRWYNDYLSLYLITSKEVQLPSRYKFRG